MVFSSILFLFRFMPIMFLIYYFTPTKYKNLVLLLGSMVFYSWGEVRYFPIMIYSMVLDYSCSLGIERNDNNPRKRKMFLLLSMIGNLGALGFFKYTNFIIDNFNWLFHSNLGHLSIVLPLGISFYTFQTMSYTIDVYRRNVKPEHNFIDFGAFVVLFPQLIAGPIVRYTDINRELKTRTVDLAQIQEGISIFILGLGKKVLIANSIGALWTEVEAMNFNTISTPLAWLGILAFSLQIFFDFSGYSLMAIGLGKMLGFQFPQNFNYPYIAGSVTEFWRRWHMTLSSWFREYLYIPLGGNRRGPARQVLNLLIVWGLTGLWHGASWNFVMWGLYFFVLLVIEKFFLLDKLGRHRLISHVYLLFVVVVSWAIFANTDISRMFAFLGRMFAFAPGGDWVYYLRNYAVVFLLGILLATPVFEKLYDRIKRIGWLHTALMLGVLTVCVAYLVDATYNPFLYFRF